MKRISEEQIIRRLRLDNPWWEKPHKLSKIYDKWKPRPYLELLFPFIKLRKVRRAVVLMGPRRAGKTVIIHHAIKKLIEQKTNPKEIFYVSVDHPIYNGLGLEELLEYYRQASGIDYNKRKCYVFFDEIQYLKNWETHLKTIVDRYPSINCTASGSAAAALRLKSIESGAGRFSDFLLPPLTFYEYLHLLGKTDIVSVNENNDKKPFETGNIKTLNKHFINYINFGGYPEAIFSEEIQSDPGRFIKSDIIDKVLLRDLPGLYGIPDTLELNRLFTMMAFNTANEISFNELARKSEISKNTIKKYMEYLEAAFLIKTVHRIDQNARHFKRANFFKIYLTNPSIRTVLFAPIDPDSEAIGSLVETAMFSQFFHMNMKLYYARWNKGEVDLVNLDATQKASWCLEIKWSDRFAGHPGDLKSLLSFCRTNNLKDAHVTTRTTYESRQVENINLEFIPSSLYCYSVGYRILNRIKIFV